MGVLKLQKMRIAGFKSFSEPTDLTLQDGITAVVGPNGCGKSNIGDAINWVLGEQSARSLRGTSMQDVIFNGSEARKPLGMAEVSLHMRELNGRPDTHERDVVITRRLFRSGDSEYLVNGARSRLKDIRDLLREARVGAQTYAIIEQGRVDEILKSRPKERRLIIEDAAGVSGFKHKRRLAELKLEATRANLLRVNDIVVEVGRQIGGLKRQAAKARRYQRFRDELRDKERARFATLARRMDEKLDVLRRADETAREAEAEVAAKLGNAEAGLVEQRVALDGSTRESRSRVEMLHQLEIRIDRAEERIRTSRDRIAESGAAAERLDRDGESLTERRSTVAGAIETHDDKMKTAGDEIRSFESRLQDADARVEASTRDLLALRDEGESARREVVESMNRLAEARNDVRMLEESIARCETRRKRLEEEGSAARETRARTAGEAARLEEEATKQKGTLDALEREVLETENQLRSARERLHEATEALTVAREQEKSAAASLETLDDVATRFAGVSDGVRTLLSSGPGVGLKTHGVVADFVEASPEVEGAADLYLRGLLPAVVVEGDEDARKAVDLLRTERAGRTHVLCSSQPTGAPAVGAGTNGRGSVAEEMLRDPRVRGRLRDRLNLKSGMNGGISDRIGEAFLVDDLNSALELHRKHPAADYLTLEGDVVYASGLVASGGSGRSDGLLAHRRRIDEARRRFDEANGRVKSDQSKAEEAREEVARLEARAESGRARLDDTRRGTVDLDLRAQRSADEAERLERHVEVIEKETGEIAAERARLDHDLVEATAGIERVQAEHDAVEQAMRARLTNAETSEQRLRVLVEEAAVLRAELSGRRERHADAQSERDRLAESLRDVDERIRTTRADADAARQRLAEAQAVLSSTEEEMARHLTERDALAIRAREGDRNVSEGRERLAESERSVTALRGELERLREASRESELARTAGESERKHLDDLCAHELGVRTAEVVEGFEGPLDDAALEDLESAIADLKEKVDRIGPVNLMAIEEFSELEERFGFLSAQKKDLEDSLGSIQESIRRINRQSRERFAEAFEAIRKNYQEVFQVLFNGGRADLVLEEGEDVLECGIDMIAQPPGKRLGNVSLLSGGEKAMAAIALLFGIFRYQPSPFCLLDEVDAALDDVNVSRFTRMLREYAGQTQFILITHNKWSMESADLLYGVTMEEPGISKLMSMKL